LQKKENNGQKVPDPLFDHSQVVDLVFAGLCKRVLTFSLFVLIFPLETGYFHGMGRKTVDPEKATRSY